MTPKTRPSSSGARPRRFRNRPAELVDPRMDPAAAGEVSPAEGEIRSFVVACVDFDQGAGWYLRVTNPHPDWRFDDPVGPYLSPEDAIADSDCLAEQE